MMRELAVNVVSIAPARPTSAEPITNTANGSPGILAHGMAETSLSRIARIFRPHGDFSAVSTNSKSPQG